MATFTIDSFLVDWGCWGIGAILFIFSCLAGWSWYFFFFITAVIITPARFLLPMPVQSGKEKGIALITGGSTGIGRALASVLAAAHYDLILVARSMNELKQAQYQLQHQYQVQVHIISKDLATPTAGQELFDEIGKMGLLDKVTILINNAGFGTVGSFLSTPLHQITNQINVNLNTLTTLTHLFGNQFKTNGGGKILQVASTAAFQPGPNMATYYATKAFVTSLSDALAYELRNSNVTVSTLCPGPVLSAFGARAGNDVSPLFKYGPVATAEATAHVAWEGLLRGDRLIIPGPNILSVLGVRIFPRSIMMVVANWLNSGEPQH